MIAGDGSASGAKVAGLLLRRGRALARSSEFTLTLIACGIGVLGGLAAVAVSRLSARSQAWLYDLSPGAGLAGVGGAAVAERWWVLPLGGLAIGLTALVWAKRGRGTPVDPVEANALRGGRMALDDSLVLGGQVLLGGAVGGPLGLDVGANQVNAAAASRLGRWLRLKRHDLRDLVGAGAAATVAATFGSPLVGAFFAFEVVVGAYSLGNVAPVIAAAVVAVLTARALGAGELLFRLPEAPTVALSDYPALLLLALLCAASGVAIMQLTQVASRLTARTRAPLWLRPVIGGLAVAGLAALAPAVMGSGRAIMTLPFAETGWTVLALLAAAKLAASVIAIGTGFRGGLMGPSLLIGGVGGKLYALALTAAAPSLAPAAGACVLVGMAALAAAVIGAPLCFAFLVLETTGEVNAAAAALAGAVLANLVVRETFGYSFSTFRLHLRGERVRGAHDVGSVRDLTVGRLMKPRPRLFDAAQPVSAFCASWPLGGKRTVVAVGPGDRYVGMLWVDDCHAHAIRAGGPDQPAGQAAQMKDVVLTVDTPVRQALRLFDRSGAPALAVVRSLSEPVVVGVLGEAYATRRYAEALDVARRGAVGD